MGTRGGFGAAAGRLRCVPHRKGMSPMLMYFRCRSCGAMIAARSEYHGRQLPCSVCREPMVVPEPPEIPVLQVEQPGRGQAVGIPSVSMDQLDENARQIAWMEASRAGRPKVVGVVLVLLGCTPIAFGSAALAAGSLFGVPFPAVAASVAFGALSAAIGLTIVRLASDNVRAEFRRRLPLVADRLRREYWKSVQGNSQPAESPTEPPRVVVAGVGGRG